MEAFDQLTGFKDYTKMRHSVYGDKLITKFDFVSLPQPLIDFIKQLDRKQTHREPATQEQSKLATLQQKLQEIRTLRAKLSARIEPQSTLPSQLLINKVQERALQLCPVLTYDRTTQPLTPDLSSKLTQAADNLSLLISDQLQLKLNARSNLSTLAKQPIDYLAELIYKQLTAVKKPEIKQQQHTTFAPFTQQDALVLFTESQSLLARSQRIKDECESGHYLGQTKKQLSYLKGQQEKYIKSCLKVFIKEAQQRCQSLEGRLVQVKIVNQHVDQEWLESKLQSLLKQCAVLKAYTTLVPRLKERTDSFVLANIDALRRQNAYQLEKAVIEQLEWLGQRMDGEMVLTAMRQQFSLNRQLDGFVNATFDQCNQLGFASVDEVVGYLRPQPKFVKTESQALLHSAERYCEFQSQREQQLIKLWTQLN